MKTHHLSSFALAAFIGFTGCVRNYNYQPPPVYVLDAPSNPSWTQEKEQKLQRLLVELDHLRVQQAKPEPAPSPTVTAAELAALKEENARRREKITFLVGEINALLIERGNKPLPYTGNTP